MVLWPLFLLPVISPALAGLDKTFGVPPSLLSKYVSLKSGSWKCLDGSREIPWDFVNDDSCDCPDGSDEPGTGACPGTTFYCRNEGHIGANIPSSRVRDGLCEIECCDGSDERPGVCENKCKEIGEVYRKNRDEELKLRKTGSKIRSTYISFAHKEKKRLENLAQQLLDEIQIKEKEVARLRDIADRSESLSQAALEHKKESPLYKSFMIHHNALKSLQKEHQQHLERERALGDILNTLRSGYNPNYQDMAVLEAVRGWEELAKLPHINDVGKDDSTVVQEEEVSLNEEEEVDPDAWTAEKLQLELDALLQTDYVTLLLEHEEHIQSPGEGSILFDLSAYLPDSVAPHYESLKDTFLTMLHTFGVIRGEVGAGADSSRAHQALSDAEGDLERVRSEQEAAEADALEIFNVHGFGAQGEWKKLDGTCLQKDTGDYTYEVCMFQEAKQIPNNGGSTFSLGKFTSWNPSPDVQPGEPAYYQKQVYKNGARCWNGPERNVVLRLACGTENAILSVQELEKCEYEFTGTSPALCLPIKSNNSREEL